MKLLEAVKYEGSLLHWTDCSDVDKRKKKEKIPFASYLLGHKEVMKMKVQFPGVCPSVCVFSWCEAQYDTFTPLWTLMGIEWMFTYHLSPLLAANVVN